jgi:hypothetical protein
MINPIILTRTRILGVSTDDLEKLGRPPSRPITIVITTIHNHNIAIRSRAAIFILRRPLVVKHLCATCSVTYNVIIKETRSQKRR